MNDYLFWCRHLLVPILFHDVTPLHPLSEMIFPLVTTSVIIIFPQPLGLHIELPLSFTPTNAAAFGVHSAKAVMFGNSVVVAGGHADVDSQQQVMFYRPDRRVWNTLGKYNLSLFAMAVLGDNRMLVLVGGYNLASDTYSNNLVQ